ncbi:hypothetical protein BsWGS_18765 [Bradybaena similaris]
MQETDIEYQAVMLHLKLCKKSTYNTRLLNCIIGHTRKRHRRSGRYTASSGVARVFAVWGGPWCLFLLSAIVIIIIIVTRKMLPTTKEGRIKSLLPGGWST